MLAFLTGFATPAAALPDAAIAIRDVTVVDVEAAALRPHMTVLVIAGRVSAVGPASQVRIPAGATVIEGHGRFVMPGLWDMHTHALWSGEAMDSFLPLFVANGVTGIRDMGGSLAILASARERVGQGAAYPRLVAAGMIIDGAEPVDPTISIAAATPEEARKAVETLAEGGADFIKVYTLLPQAAYFAVVAEARRRGLPVAGHLPHGVTATEAGEAGQRSIEHLRDETDHWCMDEDPTGCSALAATFRAYQVWQTPTLTALRKGFYGDHALEEDARGHYLPAGLLDDWRTSQASVLRRGDDYLAAKRLRYHKEAEVVRILAGQGVGILAGTDAGVPFSYPGFSLHDELALMVAAGLTPAAALRTATVEPARYLNASDSMGSVAVGHVADLVLLRSDPLADIGATRDIEAVVLRGRHLDRATLDRMLRDVATGVTGQPAN